MPMFFGLEQTVWSENVDNVVVDIFGRVDVAQVTVNADGSAPPHDHRTPGRTCRTRAGAPRRSSTLNRRRSRSPVTTGGHGPAASAHDVIHPAGVTPATTNRGGSWAATSPAACCSPSPCCIGASFLIFAMVYALPGDPIRALAGDRPLSPAVAAQLRAQFNLGDPLARPVREVPREPDPPGPRHRLPQPAGSGDHLRPAAGDREADPGRRALRGGHRPGRRRLRGHPPQRLLRQPGPGVDHADHLDPDPGARPSSPSTSSG